MISRGGSGSASPDDIETGLREHFADDLCELLCEEQEEAVEAMMLGYRYGG